jgi:hypothetical protein
VLSIVEVAPSDIHAILELLEKRLDQFSTGGRRHQVDRALAV